MFAGKNEIWISADRRTKLVYDPGTGRLSTYVDGVLTETSPTGAGTGRVVYVDAASGSASNNGRTPFSAIVSWDAAVGLCTANQGDTIVLLPNHIETITTGVISLDVAGVTTIGYGVGDNMPQIRLNHATTAEVSVLANDNVIQGVRFSADVTSVDHAIEIEDGVTGTVVRKCVFDVITTGTDEFLVSVRTNDASNFATIEDNDFDMGIGGAVAAISMTKDTDSTVIRKNRVQGDYSTACIEGLTTLSTKLLIEDNVLMNGASGDLNTEPCIQLLTGSTGVIRNNLCICNEATPAASIVADACFRDGNRYSESVDATAVPTTPVPTGLRTDINPFGTTIYVAASGGSNSNSGLSPANPKATVAAAITAAGAGGTIVLGPGTHSVDVSVSALVPLANQQFVAAIPSYGGAPSAVIANDADDGVNIVLVDVDGTVWRDIEFRNITAATACITHLKIADTSAVRGIHFENCWFNQNSLDGAMISVHMADATNATTGAVFRNCRFINATGTTSSVKYIQVGVGGAPSLLVENCVFECKSADNDARALDFLDPTTTGKSYGICIRQNQFIGPADNGLDAAPLQFAAAMTEGEIIGVICDNFFANCATPPIPIDLVNNSVVENYGNDNATGGTRVDPGT